mmetsp:Transcript_11916/g.16498  ORF Transcript_11916/g.16498 Transcript_11916/m.16498 type:complete len:343 (+) Transcript_11916:347-1375(+)
MKTNMKKLINHINKCYTSKISYANIKQTLECILKDEASFLKYILFQQSCFPKMTQSIVHFIRLINFTLPSVVNKLLSLLFIQFRESYKNHNFLSTKVSLYFIILLTKYKIIETRIIRKILSIISNQKSYFSLCIMKIILKLCLEIHQKPLSAVLRIIKIFMKKKIKRSVYTYLFSVNINKKSYLFRTRNTDDTSSLKRIQALYYDIENIIINKKNPLIQLSKSYFKRDHCLRFLIFIEKKNIYKYTKGSITLKKDNYYNQDKFNNCLDNTSSVLRKSLFIIFMSSLNAEDAFQRIHKLQIPKFLQINICTTIIECCLQEKNSLKFYITLSEILCKTDSKKFD